MVKLNMFITPLVALIIVMVIFIYQLKKANNKAQFKRFVLYILLFAFVLNYVWEIIQMPLYKDAPFTFQHTAFCALASIADALMVLLIYLCFAMIYKNPFWVQHLTLRRVFLLMLVGSVGAVLAELRHLSAGNWAYNSLMPIIPILKIGLSPVLQFMLLPVIIYYLSNKIIRIKSS